MLVTWYIDRLSRYTIVVTGLFGGLHTWWMQWLLCRWIAHIHHCDEQRLLARTKYWLSWWWSACLHTRLFRWLSTGCLLGRTTGTNQKRLTRPFTRWWRHHSWYIERLCRWTIATGLFGGLHTCWIRWFLCRLIADFNHWTQQRLLAWTNYWLSWWLFEWLHTRLLRWLSTGCQLGRTSSGCNWTKGIWRDGWLITCWLLRTSTGWADGLLLWQGCSVDCILDERSGCSVG
jgi:hypothetical protein